MGNSSVKGPKIDKTKKDGENHLLIFGSTEMQGWRNSMV